MNPESPSTNRDYPAKLVPVVMGSVILATLLRLSIMPLMGNTNYYITYFLAIVSASWLLGFRAGILTTLISALVVDYFFIPPFRTFELLNWPESMGEILFIAEGIAISALGHAQRSSRALAEANEERLRLATEGSGVGTWRWETNSRSLYASSQFKALFGRSIAEDVAIDIFMDAILEDDREVMREAIRKAVGENKKFDIEIRVKWPDDTIHWLVIRGHGTRGRRGATVRVEGAAIDITSRKRAEEAADARAKFARALNTVSRAIRETRDPSEIQQIALAELGSTLNADRCILILIDKQRDLVDFASEWHRADLPELRGEYSLATFDVDLEEIFPATTSLVISDVEDGKTLSAKSASVLRSLGLRAILAAPVAYGGDIISVLGVFTSDDARSWTDDEISFVEALASQLRSATESVRALREAEDRAEREALINRISEAMRTTFDPDEIQERAVTLLGQGLGADRCYFAVYDLIEGEVIIGNDWHRDDLADVRGVHRFKNTREMFQELYPKDPVSIIVDRDEASLSSQTVENMKSLHLRSRLSVAIADTKGMSTLTAAMADEPRQWTADDIELIKRAAAQLRPTVSMARARQREHRIASDLQAAIIPPAPASIAGLRISAYMQPALDEAEIGGDFYDVFSLGDDICAIVVGDVSGKGLAAAAQLATVRNCVRMALYRNPRPSIAMAEVNGILTAHDLLKGFVTVFIGVYNGQKANLTYTSCGHEPGLVYRNSPKVVEILSPSGVPLGIDINVEYVDNETELQSGDVLLLYTDGISESGVDRNNMLQTTGLMEIFAQLAARTDITRLAERITEQASARAAGAFRDDVCILAAQLPLSA
jgi:PAS domain S-box-containing protein